MDRLPAIVKSRAAGGPRTPLFTPVVRTPEDTFGVLRDLLYSLESRLQVVQTDVERRHALAAATPSIWPTRGWLTDSFGSRRDPFTGEARVTTPGSTSPPIKGEPVYATANGTVEAAEPSGAYGNMVVISHGFGISTRYAHLVTLRASRPATGCSAATSSASPAPPAAPPATTCTTKCSSTAASSTRSSSSSIAPARSRRS